MAEKSACQGLVQGEIFLGGQGKMIPASNLGVLLNTGKVGCLLSVIGQTTVPLSITRVS
jgi:hypothetical protein